MHVSTDYKPGGTVHPVLADLLDKDELDWDNESHREMYLRAWINGNVPRYGRQHGQTG